ncbi:CoA transferase subunit A [Sodalis ligni]|jgi:acetate CoA/acetoacetate CoA-transferase alpha subunit|uniref:Butyryl-CoA:acetoacetate CoA-transferase alpha subunit n=1 Tax=Sodalis ligni TaxID=2697027 RepID=A0A4R1NGC5_9GAMM|nr:3-oxoacid CoA-transferase subunit A [Sodalis ligni]TCL03190.1 butyryl-CoA:acetoacetate CoA-transferase alpha subunit [Sodalis ligni]
MLEKPQLTPEQAAAMIKDGMTIMIGGFMAVGTPEKIIDAIVLAGTKNLTIIANDTGLINRGVGKLIVNKQVSKMIASHIGLNPETGRQMARGELKMELVPQGTLVERIRAHGAGLGGVLTQTGLGTLVEQGKEKIVIGDKCFLLEKPLHADIALICCSVSDKAGNAIFNKTTKNFNPVMATAGDIVIAECESIIPLNQIAADRFNIPGIFIDYLVLRGNE